LRASWQALFDKITGNSDNATGFQALLYTTTGVWNNAVGFQALFDNVTGNSDTVDDSPPILHRLDAGASG